MTNGIEMQKATGNHCIKDPKMDIPSKIKMADFKTKYSGVSSPPIGSPGGTVLKEARKKKVMKIGTWNVRSLYDRGKIHNVLQEMQRLEVNIMGLSETRWPDQGEMLFEQSKIYYSGNNEQQHRNGVAIVVHRNLKHLVTSFTPISDRVIMIRIKTTQRTLNIIQVYAPTADKVEEEIDQFYDDVQQALDITKNRDITIIMGDFNAKIGKGRVDDIIGDFGLGIRNERGDRLIEFCQEHDMAITNTFYKLHERRLYTWKSPADKDNKIRRNQIDYVLIKKRYRNTIKSAKTYPGTDIGSDHNPVIVKMEIRLKKQAAIDNKKQLPVSHLKNPMVKQQLTEKINEELSKIDLTPSSDVNIKWETLKTTIMAPTTDLLATIKDTNKKKSWMTDDILQLMEIRRSYKNRDENAYKTIQKEIRKKIRHAKEKWYEGKCVEIEELQAIHDDFNLHKKIKELAGIKRANKSSILLDKNGKIIPDTKGKLERWKEYIEELFEDERQQETTDGDTDKEQGPNITKEEVMYAVKTAKNKKAPGPDETPTEIIKLIAEDQIGVLVDLYNTVYNTGIIPREWLKSTFITLPKKSNAKECKDHRTISLMSHTLKIFLKIIHRRIFRKIEQDLSETQFGFRNAMGTREALFAFNVLSQRLMDVNQPIYVAFLDYNKAHER